MSNFVCVLVFAGIFGIPLRGKIWPPTPPSAQTKYPPQPPPDHSSGGEGQGGADPSGPVGAYGGGRGLMEVGGVTCKGVGLLVASSFDSFEYPPFLHLPISPPPCLLLPPLKQPKEEGEEDEILAELLRKQSELRAVVSSCTWCGN